MVFEAILILFFLFVLMLLIAAIVAVPVKLYRFLRGEVE